MAEALAQPQPESAMMRRSKEEAAQEVQEVQEVQEEEPATSRAPVVVYINAMPNNHRPVSLSDILAPLQEEVAEENGLLYYNLVPYNKGPSHVASKFLGLLNGCHARKVLGESCFATQRDPCLAELLPILERREDVVIVRGFVG